MKSYLEDYQLYESNIPFLFYNTYPIFLSKNRTFHSRAEHIEIKHHFIRDYVQNGVINFKFIDINHQWDDIFTKLLVGDRSVFILKNLKMKLFLE